MILNDIAFLLTFVNENKKIIMTKYIYKDSLKSTVLTYEDSLKSKILIFYLQKSIYKMDGQELFHFFNFLI